MKPNVVMFNHEPSHSKITKFVFVQDADIPVVDQNRIAFINEDGFHIHYVPLARDKVYSPSVFKTFGIKAKCASIFRVCPVCGKHNALTKETYFNYMEYVSQRDTSVQNGLDFTMKFWFNCPHPIKPKSKDALKSKDASLPLGLAIENTGSISNEDFSVGWITLKLTGM